MRSKKPRARRGITVVVPFRGEERLGRLGNCLRSLTRQTLPPKEIIVSEQDEDSLASDLCVEVGATHVVTCKREIFNKSACLNVGIRASKTDHVYLLDADVILAPYALEVVARKAGSDKMVMLAALRAAVKGPTQWEQAAQVSWYPDWAMTCFGLLNATTRDAWFVLEGYDEKFSGWGFEDTFVLWKAEASKMGVEWVHAMGVHQEHGRPAIYGAKEGENKELFEGLKNQRSKSWGEDKPRHMNRREPKCQLVRSRGHGRILSGVAWRDGLGQIGLRIAWEMVRRGLEYGLVPLPGSDLDSLPPSWGGWARTATNLPSENPSWTLLTSEAHRTPPGVLGGRGICGAFSMFESSEYPEEWVRVLNAVDVIFVPAPFLVNSLRNSGVGTPIRVVGHGIDTSIATMEDPVTSPKFTVGFSGMFVDRKNHKEVIEAFQRAFPGDQDVRLRLHGRHGPLAKEVEEAASGDDRIDVIHASLGQEAYQEWWGSLDCTINLTKGEGYGLFPRESLLRGIPCVSVRHSGMEQMPEEGVFPVGCRGMEEAYYEFVSRHVGSWWLPDIREAVQGLRGVRGSLGPYREAALEGGQRVRSTGQWSDCASEVISGLHPKIVQVIPSLGGVCGIYDYSEMLSPYLEREVGGTALSVRSVQRVLDMVPTMDSPPYIIVHHELGLFGGWEGTESLSEQCWEAANRGARVIVVVHSFFRGGEQNNKLLGLFDGLQVVSLTRFVADPRVLYVPLGFPRRSIRFRPVQPGTVGTFGLYHRTKGFEELMSACAATGSRLVGNAACRTRDDRNHLRETSKSFGVDVSELGTAFRDRDEILSELSAAECIAFCRRTDRDGIVGASASIRLAACAKRPIFAQKDPFFEGIECPSFSRSLGLIRLIEKLRSAPSIAEEWVKRQEGQREKEGLDVTARGMLGALRGQ